MKLMSETSGLAPILGFLAPALIGYFSGRLLESRKQLILQKGQAYGDYLRALASSAVGPKAESVILGATDAKVRICIYGSSQVIEKLGEFEAAGAMVFDSDSRLSVSSLILAMRNDVGTSDKTVRNSHLNLILFGAPR